MAEERTSVREVQVRDFLPWLSLFRAFGIAIDPRKLLLAAAGLVVMGAGCDDAMTVTRTGSCRPAGRRDLL